MNVNEAWTALVEESIGVRSGITQCFRTNDNRAECHAATPMGDTLTLTEDEFKAEFSNRRFSEITTEDMV